MHVYPSTPSACMPPVVVVVVTKCGRGRSVMTIQQLYRFGRDTAERRESPFVAPLSAARARGQTRPRRLRALRSALLLRAKECKRDRPSSPHTHTISTVHIHTRRHRDTQTQTYIQTGTESLRDSMAKRQRRQRDRAQNNSESNRDTKTQTYKQTGTERLRDRTTERQRRQRDGSRLKAHGLHTGSGLRAQGSKHRDANCPLASRCAVQDRKSTRLNSSHSQQSRMPSSA